MRASTISTVPEARPVLAISRMEALVLAESLQRQIEADRAAGREAWVNQADLWQRLLDHGRNV